MPVAASDSLEQPNLDHGRAALNLYETQRSVLVGYAARLLGDRAHAEDVVQDAWLIFDQVPEREAIRDPVAYLRRVVRNLSINMLRKAKTEGLLSGADFDTASTIADASPSAEAEAIARQNLHRFMDRLSRLPERQQTAIRMHRMEGRKLREIAAVLDVSIAYVHSLIADGLVRCADPADGRDDHVRPIA